MRIHKSFEIYDRIEHGKERDDTEYIRYADIKAAVAKLDPGPEPDICGMSYTALCHSGMDETIRHWNTKNKLYKKIKKLFRADYADRA